MSIRHDIILKNLSLTLWQALVTERSSENGFCDDMRVATWGIIFLATPHKGSSITTMGRILTLFGYWKGSSNNLLESIEIGSPVIETLHERFLDAIRKGCTRDNIFCVYETVKEYFWRFEITYVRSELLDYPELRC